MNIFHHAIKQTLFIFSIVFTFSLLSSHDAFAATNNNVAGRAWSSNIGWINMNNCTNVLDAATCSGPDYGVNALNGAPGTMSGYAWSPNLGWITFSPANDCPAGFPQCTPYIDWANPNGDGSVNVKGWARVCSYYLSGCSGGKNFEDSLGGWDGWIALGDNNTSDGNTFGVTVSGSTMSGFAWGGDVIGWISFNGITIGTAAAPSGTLTATGCEIPAGSDQCSASYKWTTQNLIAADTAIVRDDGGADYVPAPANLASGTNPAVTIKYGITTFYLYHSAQLLGSPAPAEAKCDSSSIWDPGSSKCVLVPTVKLMASDTDVAPGDPVVLTWDSTNAASCSSSDFATAGAKDNLSPGVTVNPVATKTYSISCPAAVGTGSALGQVTITVNGVAGPECSDGVDNADPEDTANPLWDADDPGCLSGPGGSYNPNDTSELDRRRPIFKEL